MSGELEMRNVATRIGELIADKKGGRS